MPDIHWQFAENSPYPWMQVLAAKLFPVPFPDLDGPTLCVYSDYGGATKSSRFETIALLFVDLEKSGDWNEARCLTRDRFLSDRRRMSFKGLNDVQRRSALVSFLSAASLIHGSCVVVAIDKRLPFLCSVHRMASEMMERGILKSKWSPHSIERMLRVVNFVSMFVARLSHPGQNVYWISDEDDLFANSTKAADTKRLLDSFSTAYTRHGLGEIGLGTTRIDEGDLFDEDGAAVADLVAGSVADLMTGLLKQYGQVPDYREITPDTVAPKSELILDWFFSQRTRLKKCGILFSFKQPGHYRVGTWAVDESLIEPAGSFIIKPSC